LSAFIITKIIINSKITIIPTITIKIKTMAISTINITTIKTIITTIKPVIIIAIITKLTIKQSLKPLAKINFFPVCKRPKYYLEI
jgi:hypothetical protein